MGGELSSRKIRWVSTVSIPRCQVSSLLRQSRSPPKGTRSRRSDAVCYMPKSCCFAQVRCRRSKDTAVVGVGLSPNKVLRSTCMAIHGTFIYVSASAEYSNLLKWRLRAGSYCMYCMPMVYMRASRPTETTAEQSASREYVESHRASRANGTSGQRCPVLKRPCRPWIFGHVPGMEVGCSCENDIHYLDLE